MSTAVLPFLRVRDALQASPHHTLAFSVAGVAAASSLAYIVYQHSTGSSFPGPVGDQFSVLVDAANRNRTHKYFHELVNKYGDNVSIRVSNEQHLVTSDPEFIHVILKDAIHSPRKCSIEDLTKHVLFSMDGSFSAVHASVQPLPFVQNNFRRSNNLSVKKCERVLDQWKHVQSVQLGTWSLEMALDIMCQLVCSYDTMAAEGQTLGIAHDTPNTENKLKPALGVVANLMEEIIERKAERILHGSTDVNDILDMALQNNGKHKLGHKPLVGTMVDFLSFWVDATSHSVAHCLYELANRGNIEQKLYDEIVSHCGNDGDPSCELIADMKYLDWFIHEVMRFHSVAWINAPDLKQNVEWKGQTVAGGTTIHVPARSLHQDPKYFTNPSEFNPDRWANAREWLKPKSYWPFAYGHRAICHAAKANIMVTKTMLCKIMQQYKPTKILNNSPSNDSVVKPLNVNSMEMEFQRRAYVQDA